MCALSDSPIGVDVEQYRAKDYTALAKRFFSSAEQVQLQQCAERERQATFFRLWTQKESLLKALGMGLGGLPDCQSLKTQGYAFRSYTLDGYALSVCTTGEFPTSLTIME